MEKLKEHWEKNKKYYLVGGICLGIGAGGTLLLNAKSVQIVDAFKLQIKSPTINQINLPDLSTPSNPLIAIDGSQGWRSQNAYAAAVGMKASDVSRFLSQGRGSELPIPVERIA